MRAMVGLLQGDIKGCRSWLVNPAFRKSDRAHVLKMPRGRGHGTCAASALAGPQASGPQAVDQTLRLFATN